MGILPSSREGHPKNSTDVSSYRLESGYKAPAAFLHSKDPTGSLLSTVLLMDSVESWAMHHLDTQEQREEFLTRQRRLSEIINQYGEKLPPDNGALCQLLGWMSSSEAFYTLDYLTQKQPEFTVQFIGYCQESKDDDVHANVALERISVLMRSRLLDRVFSPVNVTRVMSVLLEMPQ